MTEYCDNPDHDDVPRRNHPALNALDELLDERDKAFKQNETLVRNLCEISDKLGVEPDYAKVMERIELLLEGHYKAHRDLVAIAGRLDVPTNTDKILERIQVHENAHLASNREVGALRQQFEVEKDALRKEVLLLRVAEQDLENQLDRLNSQYELLEDRYAETCDARGKLLQERAINTKVDVGAAQGALESMLCLLAMSVADPGAAKNYVEMTFGWDEGALPQIPFRKVAVVFYREGGKSPHALAEEAIAERDEALQRLADIRLAATLNR